MKTITIYEDQVRRELGDLYGLFFEDLNHAADGGLYAELVRNRSFEFCAMDREGYHGLTAWEKSGQLEWEIGSAAPLNEKNPHYLSIQAQPDSFVENSGYNTGIYVEKGKVYRLSFYAKVREISCPILVSIERKEQEGSADFGEHCAEGRLCAEGQEWKKYELRLTADQTTAQGRLRLTFPEGGALCLDMVSLFPEDTFRGRKNGLRQDIAQALCEMKPKFLRFPGGCLTHAGSLDENAHDSMYRWENTLGPVEERPSRRNSWGYNQSMGLGYYEYFLFCEDIGAKPLPVLPGGFNPHTGEGAPLEEIGKWVQEALDLIEFANGGTDTKWGGLRARMGHEKPFGLEYLAIGNEEIGAGFFERYPYFHRAVREKYPQIKLINSAGPFSVGEGYEAGWSSAKKYGSDLIDEHYYCSPEWFLANMHHYDDYDEKGPKVFLGEYASWGNTYYNALVEAAYMTHLERAKAVGLACYAPMLCNVDYVNWKPDMLWFDNHRILKTPNYYVQKLFMIYQGTQELEFTTSGLDKIIRLSEKDRLDGSVSLRGNDIAGRIRNVAFVSYGPDKKLEIADFDVSEDNCEIRLADSDAEGFDLEFDFCRTAGRKGLKIFFGKKGEGNFVEWEFGGWDNWDCNLSSVCNGRASTISHRIFRVEDRDYRLRLEVRGRRIRTYINGELYNDATYRMPELEELYLAASRDGEKTILKAVNLTGEAKKVMIRFEEQKQKNATHKTVEVRRAEVTELKENALTAENTFEYPDTVVPHTRQTVVRGNELEWEFAEHSMTVITVEKITP
ncbi:MAG: alpha-L-arabinofuranosidase C-terminal domain-containing protein [Eubacteriales bacterium]|nr:alpha-L-arabinofuranosidase C-terminal domain-containing protein [Eubacteriales bacterium]